MKVKQSEFARIAGVSKMAISNAVKTGKLKVTGKGKIETTNKTSIDYIEKISLKKNKVKKVEIIPPKKPLTNKVEKKNSSSIDKGTDKSTDEIREVQNRNLRPAWVPGQSGNPSGSKKGKRWATVISDILLEQDPKILRALGIPVTGDEPVQTFQERIILKMINMASNGNEKMIGMIIDRIDGKALQPVVADILNRGGEDNGDDRQREIDRANTLIANIALTGAKGIIKKN